MGIYKMLLREQWMMVLLVVLTFALAAEGAEVGADLRVLVLRATRYLAWLGLAPLALVIADVILEAFIGKGKSNLIKRVIGLGIFQPALFLFFISVGKLEGGTAPVRDSAHQAYSNPLPHALILTAIVVSGSITAVALAIIINIKRAYRTIEADEIDRMDSA